jgi:hypothetical protein
MSILDRIFAQVPFSVGSGSFRKNIALDILGALPDVEVSQARIAQLEAALAPFAAMVRPNNFDPKGITRFGVTGRAGNDDYRAAYAALKAKP